MATGESKTAEDPQDGWWSKNWTGAGFLPIGLVFMALGLDGNTTFFIFGVVFFVLSVTMFTQGRDVAREEPTPVAAEDSEPDSSTQAAEEEDPSPSSEEEEKRHE